MRHCATRRWLSSVRFQWIAFRWRMTDGLSSSIYTQIDAKTAQAFADKRQAKDNSFLDNGGRVDIPFITPEEALEQTNRIFAPYKWKFAAPLSWFAVWRSMSFLPATYLHSRHANSRLFFRSVNERVARTFSTPDMRVHLAGDAA